MSEPSEPPEDTETSQGVDEPVAEEQETGTNDTEGVQFQQHTAAGTMTLARYSELYSVSRNPFGIAPILPLMAFAFIGLQATVLAVGQLDENNIKVIITGFLIITLGLMLVPALVLKGSISFDDDGITVYYGKQSLSAPWSKVAGLAIDPIRGLCLLIKGQTQSRRRIRMPGGLRAIEGADAIIPLRLFGDRRFAILYEIRDRVPEPSWRPALEAAQPYSEYRPLIVYALTTLFGVGCMIAVAYALTH